MHPKSLSSIKDMIVSGNPDTSHGSSKNHIKQSILFHVIPENRYIRQFGHPSQKTQDQPYLLPNIGSNHTVKKQMLTRLNFIAKNTS
jgi:hypothetical protein